MSDEKILVIDGARTPVGSFGGVFKDVAAHELAILTLRLAKDLVRRDLETGIVTMCIGGGQALAALVRRVS